MHQFSFLKNKKTSSPFEPLTVAESVQNQIPSSCYSFSKSGAWLVDISSAVFCSWKGHFPCCNHIQRSIQWERNEKSYKLLLHNYLNNFFFFWEIPFSQFKDIFKSICCGYLRTNSHCFVEFYFIYKVSIS